MYAELAFHGGYSQASLPRHKPSEPTIYAQIDHGMSPGPLPCVPVSGVGANPMVECSSPSLIGSSLGGSVAGVMSGGGVCAGGNGVGMVPPTTSMCLGSSIPPPPPICTPVTVATSDMGRIGYIDPAPPPVGFGGHPLTPPVVPEEEELPLATVETPLMDNHKESAV